MTVIKDAYYIVLIESTNKDTEKGQLETSDILKKFGAKDLEWITHNSLYHTWYIRCDDECICLITLSGGIILRCVTNDPNKLIGLTLKIGD